MFNMFRWLRIAATVSVIAAQPACAETSGADFYNGKIVNYIVSTSPGGGFDTYGRMVAEYMQKYLPGSTFVVRNMPGAGHILGANFINGAEPDGLTIGTFNTGLVYSQLAGAEGVRFDLTKMSWIGKAASDQRAIIMSERSGIDSLDQLMSLDKHIKFSADGVGSGSYVETIMLQQAVGLPVDIVTGYNGNEDQLSMMRGETQGVVAFRSSYEQFVKEGRGHFLALIGGHDDTLPQLGDVVKTKRGQEIVALISAQGTIARLTAGPGGIPQDRLDALRTAYEKAVTDPDFLARAKRLSLPIDPLIGEDVAKAVTAALDQSPETIELLKSALVAK